MPLTNFGAILNFAELVEREDLQFYTTAVAMDAAASNRELFAALAKEGKKNLALVQRTRRENVTEMILEPIRDFTRAGYQVEGADPVGKSPADIVAAGIVREDRAVRYYSDAAEKIRALPEVSRALKILAKKRGKRLAQLEAL